MCKCEENKLKKLVAAGDDLVASIKNANWGTIRHATLHMDTAIVVWEEERNAIFNRGRLQRPVR